METSERRFRLTESALPMQGPLISVLGHLSNAEAAKQILEGAYEFPLGVGPVTRQLLDDKSTW